MLTDAWTLWSFTERPEMPDMLSEKDIRKEIKDYLEAMDWFVFPIHQQGYMCYKGISDYIAVKNGTVIFVEVKKPGGKQSEDQVKFEDNIISHKGLYFCVDSLNKLINNLSGCGLK